MQKARCECLCKTVYYTPRDRSAVQNRLIYRLKNGNARRETVFAASQMLVQLKGVLRTCGAESGEAVVTYLPRATRTRLQTGTDQARALAAELSRQSGIPMQSLIARRWYANRAQKTLSPEGRLKNAKRAYVARKRADCRGKTVVLADDLVTTGAGMATAARILHRMGAKRVICLCVAADAVNKDVLRV